MRPGFSERRGDFHKGRINVSILISSISIIQITHILRQTSCIIIPRSCENHEFLENLYHFYF